MADIAKAPPHESALVPAGEATKPVVRLSDMQLKVRELDALGRGVEYTVTLPTTVEYAKLTVDQKLWLLKTGALRACSIPMIYSIMVRAEELRRETGAKIDELAGDIYATGEGRMALSNKAKIKIANATGRIQGVEWTVVEDGDLELTGYEGPELICTVTVHVKGFVKPVILTQRLSEWYMPSNPNWKTRPEHMLRLNTYAHACEFIFPMDNDDAPSSATPERPAPSAEAVAEIMAEVTAITGDEMEEVRR